MTELHHQIKQRRTEMEENNVEHLRLYEILGFSEEEGRRIDLYQNIGRFLFKYAGSLLEEATLAVFQHAKEGRSIRLTNTISENPRTFQIDFWTSDDNKAHEIKWRDATTDGDHVRKEHEKLRCILHAGMIPVRVMFYMPNRSQALRIQERIIAAYREHGEAYVGQNAWQYIRAYAGFDLRDYFFGTIE